jgi:hypothetical protein
LLDEEWGRVPEKEEAKLIKANLRSIQSSAANNHARTRDLVDLCRIKFSVELSTVRPGRRSAATFESVQEVLERIGQIFPQFTHLRAYTDGSLLVEFAPGRFVRIARGGVTLWSPDQQQRTDNDRMSFLEVDP